MSEWREALVSRLEPLQLRPERETEIVEELSQHLDDFARDLVASGVDAADARRAALADLDAPDVLSERLGAIERRRPSPLPPPGAPARGRWLAAPWHDARQAIRSLRRTPGFATTVILALALTIGPTTAALSVGNWLLWQPAPVVREPDRVAVIWTGNWRGPNSVSPASLSYLNLQDVQRAVRSLIGVAGYQESTSSLAVEGLPPQGAPVAFATANFFDVLNVRIVAGRTFRSNDDLPPGGGRVAIISHGLAQRAFASNEAAIGKRLMLNGLPLEIVGVVEAGFNGISPMSRVQVWFPGATYAYVNRFPDQAAAEYATRERGLFYSFIGRLAPGATFDQAQAELDGIVPQLVERHPGQNDHLKNTQARVFPGLGVQPPFGRAQYQTLVSGLLLIGLLLLLLGCTNVANLLLVGGIRRQRDRAVRLAIGASRVRLVQLQLIESCLLAVAGAAAGVLLAFWLKQFIQGLMLPGAPAGMPLPDVPIDFRVLGATVAIALGCGLVAGIAPAWIGSSPRLIRLVGQADSRTTPRGTRLRTVLAATQLALSFVLVTGAFLMIRTLGEIRGIDLGFDPGGVTTHYLRLDEHGYTRARATSYYASLLPRVRAIPGVSEVSLSELAPFGSGNIMRLGRPGAQDAGRLRVYANGVNEDYFRLLSIPILRGRTFSRDDLPVAATSGQLTDGTPVVLGESLARRVFGDEDPIGKRIEESASRGFVVIGVARDAHWNSVLEPPELFAYLPFGGRDYRYLSPVLMIRSARTAAGVARNVQSVMASLDPTMPPLFARSLRATIDQDGDLSNRIVFAWSLSLLAGLGFALAGFGLVGLLAAIVSERTRELGIRLAVGAGRVHLVALVVRQACWIAVPGVIVGLGLAWFASQWLETHLYGVTRLDPGSYLAAAATVVVVVVVAMLWPGYLAARTNPIEALRAE